MLCTVMRAIVGYKNVRTQKALKWMVAMCLGKSAALDKNDALDRIVNEIEYGKASVRAKADDPFRVIKLQFGFAKARYRGLKKNSAQLTTLFALSNFWTERRRHAKHVSGRCHESADPQTLRSISGPQSFGSQR
jgi:transposase, IS5 family